MVSKWILISALFLSVHGYAQVEHAKPDTTPQTEKHKIVVVTGARFSYKLMQQWINDFNKEFPDIQIIIESRGSSDPLQYDILAEVYEHDETVKKDRQYLYVARYAVLPVATSTSRFARTYALKGLNNNGLKQIFFHNIFADKDEAEKIKAPFTVYTRYQKAGAPKVFAEYYGFKQKDIVGKAIAGSDEHLLQAVLRDSTGLTYLPVPLLYNDERKQYGGLTLIPVDLDGNGKVKDDEVSTFSSAGRLLTILEDAAKDEVNLPIGYLHLSVSTKNASAESVAFLKWVSKHGEPYLNEFGFLKLQPDESGIESFSEFAARNGFR